jgi:hypothetical protein
MKISKKVIKKAKKLKKKLKSKINAQMRQTGITHDLSITKWSNKLKSFLKP